MLGEFRCKAKAVSIHSGGLTEIPLADSFFLPSFRCTSGPGEADWTRGTIDNFTALAPEHTSSESGTARTMNESGGRHHY